MTHLEAVKKLIWLTRSDWFSLEPPKPWMGDWGHLNLPSDRSQNVMLRKWAWSGSDVGLEVGIPLLGSLSSLMLSRLVVLIYNIRDEFFELNRAGNNLPTELIAETKLFWVAVQVATNEFRGAMIDHRNHVLAKPHITPVLDLVELDLLRR